MDLERLEDREEIKKETKDKLKKMTASMTHLVMIKSHKQNSYEIKIRNIII